MDPEQGTPQGAVISPLLANLYLHSVDVAMAEAGYGWCVMPMTLSFCAEARKEAQRRWYG